MTKELGQRSRKVGHADRSIANVKQNVEYLKKTATNNAKTFKFINLVNGVRITRLKRQIFFWTQEHSL